MSLSATPPPPPDEDPLVRSLRASRRLEDAPETVIQRAIGLWPAEAIVGGWLSAVRREVARLVSDSGLLPGPALGLRGRAESSRQWLFAAEGFDVDLRASAAGEGAAGWMLAGQVLGPAEPGGEVWLRSETPSAGSAPGESRYPLDETCAFRFGPLAPGRWSLVLRLGDAEIELPSLELPSLPTR